MDLEAVFTSADNIARPVADPLDIHNANDQFLGVDFSFFPVTHASVDRKDPSGFSMLDELATSGASHLQQSHTSVSIDSDDDFGDFTSVPAESVHATDGSLNSDPFGFSANTTFKPDVENSFDMFGFHTPSSHPQISIAQDDLFGHNSAMGESPTDPISTESTASPSIPIETNSDDDWGDFVEPSTSTVWANSSEFDWFNTSQQNWGQCVSVEPAPSKVDDPAIAWESGLWNGSSQVELPKFKQNDTNFAFNELGLFDGGKIPSSKDRKVSPNSKDGTAWPEEPQIAEGFGPANGEMAVQEKTLTLKRTLSDQRMEKSSAPIPLSLFGETEIEVEGSNAELPDPLTKSFQGHSRSKARSAGSFPSDGTTSLSDLISTLYMESQPSLQMKNPPVMDSVDSNKSNDSMNNDRGGMDLFDAMIVNDGSSSLEEHMFSLSLSLEHAMDVSSSKGTMDTLAGAEVQSPEITCFELLDSASTDDRCAFVKAWASMLAICASELELALNIWKQAQGADAHLELLAEIQGKKYFAAIGQVYIVALILATASNFYKPWLSLLSEEAETSLQANLQRCKAIWLQNNLKEGVQLALDGLQGSMPSTVVPWKGIEGFTTVALEAYLHAGKASVRSICRMSLLPMASFNCLPTVEWVGSHYLLPLANMWVNCVSHEPPATLLMF